jgi:transcriptional regulator with XRE-family HTH domain
MEEKEEENAAVSPVSRAVRELRQAYGESQQAFAYRMKTAIRTIARYETVRPPHGAELGQFLELAIAKQRNDLAEVFARAIADELKMKAERIPRTIEENVYADLLFLIMRNRHGLATVQGKPSGFKETSTAFRQVHEALVANFKFLAQKVKSGKRVVGVDDDDLEILKAEVEALERNASEARE